MMMCEWMQSNAKDHGTNQEEIMVFRFSSQVFEDRLLPVSFHMVPILNLTMSDRVVHTVGLGVSKRLVPDEEVKIFDPSLRCKVSWFGWDRRPTTSAGACCTFSCCDGSGENAGR
jgi:hypothetical protein